MSGGNGLNGLHLKEGKESQPEGCYSDAELRSRSVNEESGYSLSSTISLFSFLCLSSFYLLFSHQFFFLVSLSPSLKKKQVLSGIIAHG